MESRAKLLGHPIHPMLIVFPLGLFISGTVFDGLALWYGATTFATVAYWNMVGGIVGGLLAAVFGVIDWIAIPSGTRAKRIGLMHGAANVSVVALFGLAVLMRMDTPHALAPTGIFLLQLAGVALGAVGGWLGGELVDRLGVGVDEGAHLNAPNAMSGRPAAVSRD